MISSQKTPGSAGGWGPSGFTHLRLSLHLQLAQLPSSSPPPFARTVSVFYCEVAPHGRDAAAIRGVCATRTPPALTLGVAMSTYRFSCRATVRPRLSPAKARLQQCKPLLRASLRARLAVSELGSRNKSVAKGARLIGLCGVETPSSADRVYHPNAQNQRRTFAFHRSGTPNPFSVT